MGFLSVLLVPEVLIFGFGFWCVVLILVFGLVLYFRVCVWICSLGCGGILSFVCFSLGVAWCLVFVWFGVWCFGF